jgi:hypothetical protein
MKKIVIILSSVASVENELPRSDKWAQKISLNGGDNLYKVTGSIKLLSKDGVKKPMPINEPVHSVEKRGP